MLCIQVSGMLSHRRRLRCPLTLTLLPLPLPQGGLTSCRRSSKVRWLPGSDWWKLTGPTVVEDSVYWQTRLQTEFYNVMRSKGISVNAPDRYFGAGANKMMFYGDPTMVGRPRKMDLLLSRQMMFDNTFEWL